MLLPPSHPSLVSLTTTNIIILLSFCLPSLLSLTTFTSTVPFHHAWQIEQLRAATAAGIIPKLRQQRLFYTNWDKFSLTLLLYLIVEFYCRGCKLSLFLLSVFVLLLCWLIFVYQFLGVRPFSFNCINYTPLHTWAMFLLNFSMFTSSFAFSISSIVSRVVFCVDFICCISTLPFH